MSELRTEFERLHPVPEGVVFEDDAYYSKETTFYLQAESDAIGQNTLWIGFQSGHAAGLEAAAKECERMEMFPGARQASSAHTDVWAAAAAIRAMKEPK